MRSQKSKAFGFTLIEILVALAILGILTAIAVPSYQRSVFKAKQTQARAELSSLYTSMKMYFANYAHYNNQFDAIGFRPDGTLDYAVGFAGDFSPGPNGPPGTAGCHSTADGVGAPPAACPPSTRIWRNSASAARAAVVGMPGAVPTTATSFTARAVGSINGSTVTANIDSWSIDQNKNLINSGNGM